MAKSGEPPDREVPKKPSSSEDFSTLDGPVVPSGAKPIPPKAGTTPPTPPVRPAAPIKPPTPAEPPPPKSPAPQVGKQAEIRHNSDAAVGLETPLNGIYAGSKQVPPPAEPEGPGTVYGDATFGGTPTPSTTDSTTDTIGPYWLVKLLGEGGMGQVWLADQTFPVKRKVALKLIKGGRYDHAVIQRFESERQSLAIMDHPAIAKVFDAGTTVDGQPYFVMEYVPGSPITKYCDEKRLNTRERLELFIKVCEGVQHAHQKAIIHRDLKPGNIMVTEVDGKAAPHIIDFGIAKATENKQEGETLLTQVGMLVGTPGYMAPEQTDPSAPDIDTRADVYALGVILYELLTGSLPFDSKQWQKQPLYEILRQIREDDPPRPSTQLITEAEAASEYAAVRQAEPRQLASLLKGDLDWITMKALEKDRARRYDSPTALAADIRRYLTDEPVLATPPSVAYRTSKFVKRHRVGVLAAATVFLMLIALAVSMTVQAYRIARERDRANREATASKSVSDFLIGLFNVSDPSEARGNSITAREILDQGAKQIETNLTGQPEVQARLLETIGTVYQTLGLYSQSRKLLEESIKLRRQVLGPKNPEVLQSLNELARALRLEGNLSGAESVLQDALRTDRSALGPENPVTLSAMIELANILHEEGRLEESEKLKRETLEIQKRVLGPENPETLRSMTNLGLTLGEEGRLPEAEAQLREALDLRRKVLGPDHPETLRTAFFLADYLSTDNIDNHLEEAEKLQRETLEFRRHVLGDTHPDTLETMDSLANILQLEKHYAEAEKLRRDILDVERRVLGPEHPITLVTMTELANNLSVQGRYQEANALLQQTLAIQKRVRGVYHPETAETEYNLACNDALEGHKSEALALLKEAFEHGLSPLNKKHMAEDPDLKSLHGNPEFEALVAEAQKNTHEGKKPDLAR
jgi:eukaryotic-like serine/threonine-protein kinase